MALTLGSNPVAFFSRQLYGLNHQNVPYLKINNYEQNHSCSFNLNGNDYLMLLDLMILQMLMTNGITRFYIALHNYSLM